MQTLWLVGGIVFVIPLIYSFYLRRKLVAVMRLLEKEKTQRRSISLRMGGLRSSGFLSWIVTRTILRTFGF